MKDKEMIEEIDEIITQCCKNVPNKECVDYPDCVRCWATKIYNAGYRKVKDSVVISREEYEKGKEEYNHQIHRALVSEGRAEKASKETAEKFYKKVKNY